MLIVVLFKGTSSIVRGTIHSPVRVHFLPVSTVVPLYFTVTSIIVILTSHPALHSVTMEIRECELSPGMTCATLAARGSLGRSNIPTCVDCILLPSGSVTWIGSSSGFLCARGASETKKFPVAPESSTAHFLMSFTLKSIVAKRLLAACPYNVLDVYVGDRDAGTDCLACLVEASVVCGCTLGGWPIFCVFGGRMFVGVGLLLPKFSHSYNRLTRFL